MRSRVRRVVSIISITAGVLIVLIAGLTAYAAGTYPKTWDIALPTTRASDDPDLIARGRYIVYGPGRCADCHVADAARDALNRGDDAPLTGGSGEQTFLGSWTAPNLTPDPDTGLGRVSDGQIARMLRTGVNRDGHIALPFMDADANLTERDVVAILSFLRSLPPAPGVGPRPNVNLLGKITLAYFLGPYGPTRPIREDIAPEPTAAYGEYVARTLGGCPVCHTARNLRTGAYLSEPFAGGLQFRARLTPGYMYVTPNLTPDPDTGHITAWTEDAFVARFRAGLLVPDSPMPWPGFQRMTETDARALYRFLRTLAPVRHDVGPKLQPAHGDIAG